MRIADGRVEVSVTRDSVCAGDDVDAPHERRISVVVPPSQSPDGADGDVERLVRAVCRELRLASISGGKATWCVSSGVPLAVVAQEWETPRLVRMTGRRLEELDWRDGVLRVHVSYLAQVDPSVAAEVLSRLTLRQN